MTPQSSVLAAADALLMAITAAETDETGQAIPFAITNIYADRLVDLEVATPDCATECPALGRAVEIVGGEFGKIISGQMILQIALVGRLSQELGLPYDEVLRDVLHNLPAE
jgi:hypothetical protein